MPLHGNWVTWLHVCLNALRVFLNPPLIGFHDSPMYLSNLFKVSFYFDVFLIKFIKRGKVVCIAQGTND